MIKRALLNFLKGLKFYLTPYGTILLFFALGLCIVIPAWVESVTVMVNKISEIYSGVEVNWGAMAGSLTASIVTLDWKGDFSGCLSRFVDGEFLNKILSDATYAAFGREDISALTAQAVGECVMEILIWIIVFIVILVLGIIAAFIVVRMLMRHEVASVGLNFLRFLLRALLDAVVLVGAGGFAIWLTTIWNHVPLWVFILIIVIVYAVITLFKAYLVYGVRRVHFFKVMNPLQIVLLYLGDVIIIAMGAAFILFFFFVVNLASAIILGVPLLIITLVVFDINAESYVKSLDDDARDKIKEERLLEKQVTKKEAIEEIKEEPLLVEQVEEVKEAEQVPVEAASQNKKKASKPKNKK